MTWEMHTVEPADETRNSTPGKTSLDRVDFTDLMENRDILFNTSISNCEYLIN